MILVSSCQNIRFWVFELVHGSLESKKIIAIMHIEQTLKLKVAISKTDCNQYTFNRHDFIKKQEQKKTPKRFY